MKKSLWLWIGLAFAGWIGFSIFKAERERVPISATPAAEIVSDKQRVSALCASVKPAEEAEAMAFVYKIDGTYMVYVEPSWYRLRIDEKKAVAAFVARCKLGGSARFMDSRTGKLLARWGEYGYVNNEE